MAAVGRPSWCRRWRLRAWARDGARLLLLLLLLGSVQGPWHVRAGQAVEYLKREHSLSKPYQGVGTSSSSLWNLMGNAMVMTQYIRLTPDMQSKQGALWNRVPCFLKDWELQVHFKIHGQGKKNLHGDGLAIWYTKDRMQPGPVFGNMDKFVGLGVFVDTYPNEEKQQERVFPYISAMVNNGSLSYDHERDGRPTELGGCTAIVRNLRYDTFLVIRYVKRHLTIMMDIDGKHEWRDCIEMPGVRLPRGYYFGTSSITGDLSDPVKAPVQPLLDQLSPGATAISVCALVQAAHPACVNALLPHLSPPFLLPGFSPCTYYCAQFPFSQSCSLTLSPLS